MDLGRGSRACTKCGADFEIPAGTGRKPSLCRGCARTRHTHRRPHYQAAETICERCGTAFHGWAQGRKKRFCSRLCCRRYFDAQKYWKGCARQRAKHYGVRFESFDRVEIFERDGWTCRICGDPTPRELLGLIHPKAPELDHVIPISKGGPHTRENAQCACRACNMEKRDTMPSLVAAE